MKKNILILCLCFLLVGCGKVNCKECPKCDENNQTGSEVVNPGENSEETTPSENGDTTNDPTGEDKNPNNGLQTPSNGEAGNSGSNSSINNGTTNSGTNSGTTNSSSTNKVTYDQKKLKEKLVEYGKLVYENRIKNLDKEKIGIYEYSLKEMKEKNGFDISMFVNPKTKEFCNFEKTKIEFIVGEIDGKKVYELYPTLVCGFENEEEDSFVRGVLR